MKIFGVVCLLFFCGEKGPDSACEKSFAAEKEQWRAEKELLLARLQEAERSSAKFWTRWLQIDEGTADAAKVQEQHLRSIEKDLAQVLEEIMEFYSRQKKTKVGEESIEETRIMQTIKQKEKILQQITVMLQDVESANLYSGRWVQIPKGFGGQFALDLRLIRRICWLVHVHLFWKFSPIRHVEAIWIKIYSRVVKSSQFFHDFWLRFEADVWQFSLQFLSADYGRIQSYLDNWLNSVLLDSKQDGISAHLALVAEVSNKALAKLSSSIFTQFPNTWIWIQKSVLNAFTRVKSLTIYYSPGLLGSEVRLDSGTLEVVILCSMLMAFVSIVSGFLLHRFHILCRSLGGIQRVVFKGFWEIYTVGKLITTFVSKATLSLVSVGIRIFLLPFSITRYRLASLFRKMVVERQNEMLSSEPEIKGWSTSSGIELNSSFPAATVANIIAAFESERRMQRWGTYRKRSKPKGTKRKKAWSP